MPKIGEERELYCMDCKAIILLGIHDRQVSITLGEKYWFRISSGHPCEVRHHQLSSSSLHSLLLLGGRKNILGTGVSGINIIRVGNAVVDTSDVVVVVATASSCLLLLLCWLLLSCWLVGPYRVTKTVRLQSRIVETIFIKYRFKFNLLR